MIDTNENVESSTELSIRRSIYTEKSFRNSYGYNEPVDPPLKDRILKILRPKETDPIEFAKKFIFGFVPILYWLPRYKVKKWLLADVISGLTVGIMHIPQGMSYALLAGQHPIYGLYNSFFPVILYCILGTSRHTSMGTFALTSLMLGNAMAALAPDPVIDVTMGDNEQDAWNAVYDRRILLGSACMFITGIFLFGLSILRVGSVVVYLSEPMISGFTFGAAVHILVAQFKSLLGVNIGSYVGPLNLIWVLRDLILALVNLDDTQKTKTAATVVISVICLIFLIVLKELNLKYKEKIPLGLPLPGEMIVVVVGTGISYGTDLSGTYGVSIIGNIPSGIPSPVVPALGELSSLVGYAIPIAIVGYSVAVSIAKIFGNKFGYEIRPNQELVAYGLSNTVCSFFSCFPAFPSMSRSCVQVGSGGKTQVVGLIASAIILLVLLVIGPLFSTIPKACLASIICVAMKGMLKRALDLKSLWKTSKLDFATWIVAAFGTLLLDVVYGLCVGVGFSLLCIVFRTQLMEKETLGRVGDTELYRKINQYEEINSVDGVCVGAFRGPLHYVNKESFRKTLINISGIDPVAKLAKKKKLEKLLKKEKADKKQGEKEENTNESRNGKDGVVNTVFSQTEILQTSETIRETTNESQSTITVEQENSNSVKFIVLDCAQISFMDSVGAKVMATVSEDFNKIGVRLLLASCSGEILRMLTRSEYFVKFGEDTAYVSVHDAVTYAIIDSRKSDRAKEESPTDDIADDVPGSIDTTRL